MPRKRLREQDKMWLLRFHQLRVTVLTEDLKNNSIKIAEEFVLNWKQLFISGQNCASLLQHQHKIFHSHTSPGVASPLNEAERRPFPCWLARAALRNS